MLERYSITLSTSGRSSQSSLIRSQLSPHANEIPKRLYQLASQFSGSGSKPIASRIRLSTSTSGTISPVLRSISSKHTGILNSPRLATLTGIPVSVHYTTAGGNSPVLQRLLAARYDSPLQANQYRVRTDSESCR